MRGITKRRCLRVVLTVGKIALGVVVAIFCILLLTAIILEEGIAVAALIVSIFALVAAVVS